MIQSTLGQAEVEFQKLLAMWIKIEDGHDEGKV